MKINFIMKTSTSNKNQDEGLPMRESELFPVALRIYLFYDAAKVC